MVKHTPCSNKTAHCSAGTKGRRSKVFENQTMTHKGDQRTKGTRGKIQSQEISAANLVMDFIGEGPKVSTGPFDFMAWVLTPCPDEQQGSHVQHQMLRCLMAENTSNHASCTRPHADDDKVSVQHPPCWWYLPQSIDSKIQASYCNGCSCSRRHFWPHAVLPQWRFIILGEEVAESDKEQSQGQRGKNPSSLSSVSTQSFHSLCYQRYVRWMP